jgi:hypothetical protein
MLLAAGLGTTRRVSLAPRLRAEAYCPDEPLVQVCGWGYAGRVLQSVTVRGSSCEVTTIYRDQEAFMENVVNGHARVAPTSDDDGWLVLITPKEGTPPLVRRTVEVGCPGGGVGAAICPRHR